MIGRLVLGSLTARALTVGMMKNGEISSTTERFLWEFVEDNDDQDRTPDWGRSDALSTDRAVFPGWDENNDFVPDFNQNDNTRRTNLVPDYEEPFLRQNVDRPEFLYGIDANNNTWVDRFENDNEPDFPYKRDHRGFNVYAGAYVIPRVRFTLGYLRDEKISTDQRNYATYGLLSIDLDHQIWGQLRILEVVKSMKDDIADNLLQWDNRSGIRSDRNIEVIDPMLGRDTFYNSFYIGHEYSPTKNLTFKNSLKHDLWHQRMDAAERASFGLGSDEFFFGVINKLDYFYELGRIRLMPRWKSEYRRQSYDLFTAQDREELTEIFGTVVDIPLLTRTTLTTGVEYVIFKDIEDDINNFKSFISAGQVTNVSDYQGYRLTTQVGMKFDVRDFEDPGIKTKTVTEGFITVYAGLGN